MPINIGITFLIGGVLGWVAVKILRPARHLEGLIIANCSAGNLGNLMLMTIPAVCGEAGNPFGEKSTCSTRGLSYVSASMAVKEGSSWKIWDGATYEMLVREGSVKKIANESSIEEQPELSTEIGEDNDSQLMEPLLSSASSSGKMRTGEHIWRMVIGTFHELADELVEPPTVAAMAGFVVGAIPWLKSLIIGNNAPLRVIQDSAVLLGINASSDLYAEMEHCPALLLFLEETLQESMDNCITKAHLAFATLAHVGIGKSAVKPSAILAIALVRYVALPISGIFVVRAAASLGFLPQDPLFSYVLLTQFTLPPAVAIACLASLLFFAEGDKCIMSCLPLPCSARGITTGLSFLSGCESRCFLFAEPLDRGQDCMQGYLLLIGSLGAFLAYGNGNIFSGNVRRDLNKIVFFVFSPALVLSSLAQTVTLQELISWWFMPVNIAITFLIGGILGWVAVKILRPPRHFEGLIMATCSAGKCLGPA
ncbi:hypothetical protein HPP92_022546 [Vanilla planifolia]|nr:hypothetical protein HPP92_022546 [Vanilla planifolia]